MLLAAWVIKNEKNKYYLVGDSVDKPIKWVNDQYAATYFDSEEEARHECRTMKLTALVYKIYI